MGEPARSLADLAEVPEVRVSSAAELDAQLRQADAPFVVRGLAAHWPLVEAGKKGPREARAYLLQRRVERPFTVSVGEPAAAGRLFYDDGMSMNFRTFKADLPEIFAQIDALEGRPDAPAIYLGSVDVQGYFQGVHEANHLDLSGRDCIESIWIGTRTRIAAHNDFPDNLACVAVGRRRFTLFPPDQFNNLYPGPLDNTPAGRPISMVDFANPDFARHPRFREALAHAQTVELEPGDALHIPSMWWHHVEALEPFNVLVNYWWRDTPRFLGKPADAMVHAILAIRDLPPAEKAHWRDLFDHYVFNNTDDVVAHIPEEGRSVLAPLTAESAGRIRAFLLRALSQ